MRSSADSWSNGRADSRAGVHPAGYLCIVSVLIFAALLLSIWGLWEERMTKKKQITTTSGSEDAA
jgi:hypothetical protein